MTVKYGAEDSKKKASKKKTPPSARSENKSKQDHKKFTELRARHKAATHESLELLRLSMLMNNVLESRTSDARADYAERMSQLIIKEEDVINSLLKEVSKFRDGRKNVHC